LKNRIELRYLVFISLMVVSVILDILQSMYSGNLYSNLLLNIGVILIVHDFIRRIRITSERHIFPVSLALAIIMLQVFMVFINSTQHLSFLNMILINVLNGDSLLELQIPIYVMVFFAFMFMILIIKQKQIPSFLVAIVLCLLYTVETIYRLMNTGKGFVSILMMGILLAFVAVNIATGKYLINRDDDPLMGKGGSD